MGKLRFTSGALVVSLFVTGAAPSAFSQTCNPPTVVNPVVVPEFFFDDVLLYTEYAGPTLITHASALKVMARDIDFNTDPHLRNEIIIGGNGNDPPVQIVPLVGHQWLVSPLCPPQDLPEDVSGIGSSLCYDLEVEYLNDDDWPDITVSRRLPSTIDFLHPFAPTIPIGHRSTVYLNDGPNAVAGDTLCNFQYFKSSGAIKIPQPVGSIYGDTFTIAYGHISRPETAEQEEDHLDLVMSGADYGVRYYVGHGDGTFTYALSDPRGYFDESPGTGQPVGYRDVELADVDGDADLDMFVSRTTPGYLPPVPPPGLVRPNSVWFNVGTSPYDPFVQSTQPPITLPNLESITWIGDPAGCDPTTSGAGPLSATTMESAFGDLDLDGDLDVVCANFYGWNAAYLNNGHGYYGSLNTSSGPSDMNNGCAAFKFPPITPNWSGHSEALFLFVKQAIKDVTGVDPVFCGDKADYIFTIPGSVLNNCTGVTIADLNADGLPEAGFSNRNDWEEGALNYNLPYLDANPGNPVPDTYDYVFINVNYGVGLSFCATKVEQIGEADDGTGYGDFIKVDRNRRYDWVDANFSNYLVQTQLGANHIDWGKDLVGQIVCPDPPQQAMAGPGGDFGLDLDFAADYDFAGLPYQVLASASSSGGSMKFAGEALPLEADLLTDLLLGKLGAYSGASGVLDKEGAASIHVSIPPEFLSGEAVSVVVVVLDGSQKAAFVSSVLEVPVP